MALDQHRKEKQIVPRAGGSVYIHLCEEIKGGDSSTR